MKKYSGRVLALVDTNIKMYKPASGNSYIKLPREIRKLFLI